MTNLLSHLNKSLLNTFDNFLALQLILDVLAKDLLTMTLSIDNKEHWTINIFLINMFELTSYLFTDLAINQIIDI